MAKQKKQQKQENVTIPIFPTPMAENIGAAFGTTHNPVFVQEKTSNKKPTWESLIEVSNGIAEFIGQMAADINESVELVKRVGCDHIAEFNVAVNKTNADFTKFLGDFEIIKAKHSGKKGIIDSADDIALSLAIFEDYQQFHAYFNGVMHHSLISFTEYALEAQDRLKKQFQQEQQNTNQEGQQ